MRRNAEYSTPERWPEECDKQPERAGRRVVRDYFCPVTRCSGGIRRRTSGSAVMVFEDEASRFPLYVGPSPSSVALLLDIVGQMCLRQYKPFGVVETDCTGSLRPKEVVHGVVEEARSDTA